MLDGPCIQMCGTSMCGVQAREMQAGLGGRSKQPRRCQNTHSAGRAALAGRPAAPGLPPVPPVLPAAGVLRARGMQLAAAHNNKPMAGAAIPAL